MAENLKSIDANHLRELLTEMGKEFLERGEWAEIAIYGGAALLLHFGDRASTRDIDYRSIDSDRAVIDEIASIVGDRHGLGEGWFNDAVSFSVEDRTEESLHGIYPRFASEGGLRVFLASPRYILAMKFRCLRSSIESHDLEDVWKLIDPCDVHDVEAAESLLSSFFPGVALPTRNKSILQDVFEAKAAGKDYDVMMGW